MTGDTSVDDIDSLLMCPQWFGDLSLQSNESIVNKSVGELLSAALLHFDSHTHAAMLAASRAVTAIDSSVPPSEFHSQQDSWLQL